MNSNIQQLLNQSTFDILGVNQVDQEMFARLVIEKCAEIIDGMQFCDEGPSDAVRYQRTLCSSTIKEYFGLIGKSPISSRNLK